MKRKSISIKLQSIVILIFLSMGILGCDPKPDPIAQIQETPSETGIEIIEIREEKTVPFNISQEKIFDQCASGSPFKAEIRFSQSAGQESQKELVLTASAGGEVEISPVAKLNIGAAIQGHFSNKQTESRGHEESVSIEVPPHVQQRYTIIWQESREEGSVEYIENGEHRTINYSYQIGIQLLSSKVEELECPGSVSSTSIPTSTPTSVPTSTPTSIPTSIPTPVPTYTPLPTYTPYPTKLPSTPTNVPIPTSMYTAPDSILAVGEGWNTDGRELVLNSYTFESTRIRFEIRFINKSGNTITFDASTEDFALTDNLGRRDTASYPLGCGSGGTYDLTIVLESGASKNCRVYFNDVDYGNSQVNQLIFSATVSVFQNARWQIPIQH